MKKADMTAYFENNPNNALISKATKTYQSNEKLMEEMQRDENHAENLVQLVHTEDPQYITIKEINQMVKDYEADIFSEEKKYTGHRINKKAYFELKKVYSEMNSNLPINPDDITEYPGSSKGRNPEDNPEHFKIWLKQELQKVEDKVHPDYHVFN